MRQLPAHLVDCPDERTCLAMAMVLEAEGVQAVMVSNTRLAISPDDVPGGVSTERLNYVLTTFQFQDN